MAFLAAWRDKEKNVSRKDAKTAKKNKKLVNLGILGGLARGKKDASRRGAKFAERKNVSIYYNWDLEIIWNLLFVTGNDN